MTDLLRRVLTGDIMTQTRASSDSLASFGASIQATLSSCPCAQGQVAMSQTPAVVDVMGGIVEDSGSLVLTTTLQHAYRVAAWHTAADGIQLRFYASPDDAHPRSITLPFDAVNPTQTDAAAIQKRCQNPGEDWATASALGIRQAIADTLVPQPQSGLMFVIQTDFPANADLGRHTVQATSTIDALCKLHKSPADNTAKAHAGAIAAFPLRGMLCHRTAMTALCGAADGSLMQLRFEPHVMCDKLELPNGIRIIAAKTKLTRPTTAQRLMETRICAQMGHRMIADLQRRDGIPINPNIHRLGAITPTEYVERYRDRLPPKITGKIFSERFGSLRGIYGDLGEDSTYKVRSRAEHHIYENRRVHEFATSIVRARRNGDLQALIRAGELMYASHWSHSQRCGIGGVETDRLVTCIRQHGPQAGLFGTKVTAGGEGGEVVVLMRDDPQAHAALAQAISAAEAASQEKVHTFSGSLAGADFFDPPALSGTLVETAEGA